jgi:hypothetical protein
VKSVPPAYSVVISEGEEIEKEEIDGEDVKERTSRKAGGGVKSVCYLTLVDHKSSMQMDLIFQYQYHPCSPLI